MQFQSQRRVDDLSNYREQPNDLLLLPILQRVSKQIKCTASTMFLCFKTFQWRKKKESSKYLTCYCSGQKDKISPMTQRLIQELDKGLDPLDLSKQRWAIEEKQSQKQNLQEVQNIKESYIAYLNKKKEKRRSEKQYRKIVVQRDEKEEIDDHLWSIAEEKMRVSRGKIQEWKQEEQKSLEAKLKLPQPSLEQPKQQPFQEQKTEIIPSNSDQKVDTKDPQQESTLTVNEVKGKDQQQNSPQKEGYKEAATKKDQVKTPKKFNPFINPGSNKKVNLLDLIGQKTNPSLFGISGQKDEKSSKQTYFSHPLPNQSQYQPIYHSQKRKQSQRGQPLTLPSNTFGTTLTSNMSHPGASNQLLSSSRQPSSDVFKNINPNGSEGHKLLQMFGVSKPKTENSLFQDSRSEKTERKPQSYPNRRSKNKSNQLRVS